jgi:hypothetical protein
MSVTRYLLLIVVALTFAAGACVGQERKYEPPTQMDIAIGNYKFFDILTPAAGYTVDQRQKLVNERLIDIFAAGHPKPVTVGSIRGKPTIYVNGIKLVTVYPRDVQAAQAKCTQSLAAKWAARVYEGLPRVWPGCRFPTRPAAAAADPPEASGTPSP